MKQWTWNCLFRSGLHFIFHVFDQEHACLNNPCFALYPSLISVECFKQVFLLHYELAKRKETNATVKRLQYISHDDH